MPETVFIENHDLRDLTDSLRRTHSIFKNKNNEWVLLHHQDIVAAAKNDTDFSSSVSRFLQIPNGLDGEQHSKYRKLIEKYLTAQAIKPYIADFQNIADDLIQKLFVDGNSLDAVKDLGAVYAVRAQSAWLGWPAELEPDLLAWIKNNWQATRSGDISRTTRVANDFDGILNSAFDYAIRRAEQTGLPSVTARLYNEKINGRPLNQAEKVSILRNWTAGDLGTISLCIGVIIVFLVRMLNTDPDYLDELSRYTDTEIDLFINEIIRLDNPFIASRRVTTRPVNINGIEIPAGEKIRLNWISANRDETVFGDNKFCPVKHAKDNLVYGVGKHLCPGKLLATIHFRVFLRSLLKNTQGLKICIDKHRPFVRARAPIGGYVSVPIIISS